MLSPRVVWSKRVANGSHFPNHPDEKGQSCFLSGLPFTACCEPWGRRGCLIIVPHYSKISLPCQQSLKRLERKGYFVRRVQGYAAIDQARNQLATDAMIDGFEETLWVNPDCLFHPDDVDRFRAWQLPVCTAAEVEQLPATPIRSAATTGKLSAVNRVCPLLFHVRRQAFSDLQRRLALPVCN